MLNDIRMTVSGNVTRDPEVKFRRSDGRPFAVVPIAVNERRYDQASQRYVQAGVTYYDIICPGSLGANALQSLAIGTPVVAHGRFTVHEWSSETARGARPQVRADSLGIDLTWGTTSYAKGSCAYPGFEDDYETSAPPRSEGGPDDEVPTGPGAEQELGDDLDLPAGMTVDANGEVFGDLDAAESEHGVAA